ncbi:hypothetical protein PPROV_000326800 [Pycnococcus provasolii]|uniref:phenylalanine--tRNA ligase n=3 Tax=Pycnococcus provasolii TaxID=41880 RepID=A0A830HBR3_9CHLO|nr:hypothetical protein PPROV_000326800 [Pycnococcus provasolii]
MPVVPVNRDKLFAALGQEYTETQFEDLCFEYGVELDEVMTEAELRAQAGDKEEAPEEEGDDVIYKIDIPANRYDLLCVEGISRALKTFVTGQPAHAFTTKDMKAAGTPLQRMVVKPETALVRPFVVCAVLRGIKFDKQRYKSFIDLQDKLHMNLCRQRTLVAIGTHDLNKIKGPFTYEALPPEEIKFVPLKQTREFTAPELFQHYKNDESGRQLRKFLHIIEDSLVYPVIYDANRTVLSLPPIINGSPSQITLDTTDVFIECTATDLTKAKVTLNTVCAMFSEYCTPNAFEVEPVEVVDAFGDVHVFPDMSERQMTVPTEYINRNAGIELDTPTIATLLNKMMLRSSVGADGSSVHVSVPVTRSDVLHPCDVVEDVAIAYGYNNIKWVVPKTSTVGGETPVNAVSDMLRQELAMCGYTEILTWALCSHDESFAYMRKEEDIKGGNPVAVTISNPATAEFQVARTTLLSGALKTVGANAEAPLPLKVFEVNDVLFLDNSVDVGAKNHRHAVAVYMNVTSGFEAIHQLVNRTMEVLGIVPSDRLATAADGSAAEKPSESDLTYDIEPANEPQFFPGRQAYVVFQGKRVGVFGIVHPDVLNAFGISRPCSAMEIQVEPFVFDQFKKPLNCHPVHTE